MRDRQSDRQMVNRQIDSVKIQHKCQSKYQISKCYEFQHGDCNIVSLTQGYNCKDKGLIKMKNKRLDKGLD